MSRSLWLATADRPEPGVFEGRASADVVVIGAGITGLTAADLLSVSGRKVIVVDMLDPGEGETGHTTAHLTVAFDRRYHTVARKIGEDAASLIALASESAIDWLESRCHSLDTGRFHRVDGWLYCETDETSRISARSSPLRVRRDSAARSKRPLRFLSRRRGRFGIPIRGSSIRWSSAMG